jgi:hypothetical protein
MSATPTAEPSPPTFEEFAVLIADSVQSGSSELFLQNPILTEFECPNKLLGDCGNGPEPTVIQSLVLARWRSEGYPATEAEFEAALSEYYAKGPRIVALAVKESEGDEGTPTYYAITAAEDDAESTAIFSFKQIDGEFRLHSFMLAPVLGEDWTSGECGECYDQWDPW